MFQQDNHLMMILTRIGNYILVSLFWLLTCIPVVTIIPACAALYHTITKVVRINGNGVMRDYFYTFWHALKPGFFLSLVCIAISLLLYTCLDFGYQMMRQNIVFGTAYFAIGCIFAVLWVSTVLFIAPVLSRFDGNTGAILRIALYLPSKNILRVLWMFVMLAAMAFFVDFYPLLLLIIPALYADLICNSMEKALKKFMDMKHLTEDSPDAEKEPLEKVGEISALEQAKILDDPNE